MKRFKITPACYLVLIKENKILLQRRYNTGYEDGKYSVVAGHLDGNESFKQAMVREAKEEANIDIKSKDLNVVHVMHRSTVDNDNERIDVFLSADKWDGEIENLEPHKCDDLKWFVLDQIPDNVIPYVKSALKCIENNIFYSEFGF